MSTPPKGLEIIKASYGAEGIFEDVTKQVKDLVKDGTVTFNVSAQSLGILDPAPGVKKTFQANVSINGAEATLLTKQDGEQFTIKAPTVKSDEKASDGTNAGFVFMFFFVSLVGSYLAYSFFKFGSYGVGSIVIGLGLAAIISGSFLTFSNSKTAAGVLGILGGTFTALILPVLIIIGLAFFGWRFDWTYGEPVASVPVV
jgi:hypothetical protein